jgi:hypothetical protein
VRILRNVKLYEHSVSEVIDALNYYFANGPEGRQRVRAVKETAVVGSYTHGYCLLCDSDTKPGLVGYEVGPLEIRYPGEEDWTPTNNRVITFCREGACTVKRTFS